MSDQTASASGLLPAPEDVGSITELERLRATRRRQATVIDTLGEAVSKFQRAAAALKAENAELRVQNALLSGPRRSGAGGWVRDGELIERTIASGPDAPRLARTAVAQCLGERVAACVVENARLLVSELVTNSVRHSGARAGEELIVRVHLSHDVCRLEVEDPGHDGVIATRPPDLIAGGGRGLNLVEMLSEHWGVVRAADGPTRVWVQLPRATALAHDARPPSRTLPGASGRGRVIRFQSG